MPNTPMPGYQWYVPAKWIRVSAVLDFLRCPRRFFYHYGCGLVPSELRLALTFGEAIHASLGWLLGHPDDLPGALIAFDKIWLPLHEAENDPKRNKSNAVRILLVWLEQHQGSRSIYQAIEPPSSVNGLSPTEVQSDFELPFAIDIGLDIPLVGRIDALARHRNTGELWTVEFKTTSQLTASFLDGFRLNPQALLYNLACRSQGIETKGTFIEALEVKAPLKTKDSTPKVQITAVEFRPHLMEDTLTMLRWAVGELMEYERRQSFPKRFTGCHPYASFGIQGFQCDYSRLCETEDWTVYKDTYIEERDQVFVVPTVGGIAQ